MAEVIQLIECATNFKIIQLYGKTLYLSLGESLKDIYELAALTIALAVMSEKMKHVNFCLTRTF